MNTSNKKHRSAKFLIAPLLVLAATTVPLSLALSSCTTTSNSKSITVTGMSSTDQTITVGQTASLYVNANYSGTGLTYQWYKAADANESSWTIILGANSSSYTIPDNEVTSAAGTTLKYRVVITASDDSTISYTSPTFSVTVNSATESTVTITSNLSSTSSITSGTATTYSVTATTTETNATLYYNWYLNTGSGFTSVQNSTENSYTISADATSGITSTTTWSLYVLVYVNNDTTTGVQSDTCTITISPASTTIYARNANSQTGLTTVQYDQEKWIGDNEVSIAINTQPSMAYLKSFASTYVSANSNDNTSTDQNTRLVYDVMSNLNTVLASTTTTQFGYQSTAGTGWILDYSTDSSNSNLVNYYIATNIHVLESTYSITYTRKGWTGLGVSTDASVTISVPINSNTVSNLGVYLSQPQYSTTNSNNNLAAPFGNDSSTYSTGWHKTSITADTLASSLIPIGSYTTSGAPSLSTAYGMQISYAYTYGGAEYESDFYYPEDGSSGSTGYSYATQNTNDFSVLKLTESKTAFDNVGTNATWTTAFTKMKEIFKVDTDDSSAAKNSSYIARLNALLTLAKGSSYDKTKAEELFMFADYNKDLTDSTIISVAGFPGTTSNGSSYINFNSNTISYSLATSPGILALNSRESIAYNYQGKLYYSKYTWANDILLPNVNLMSGSSGSMNVTQDYKIMGIYWGVFNTTPRQGITTKIYSYSDSSSVVMRWLKYVQSNDTGSVLNQVFTALNTKGYFS